ncbi:DUF3097 domain-containing protein [Microcella sp.]|uniref:DUF3097 domain-containing protein n=1 Tax=Microcella sp. TaxID=1913979 RepID=UPI00299F65BA|nr:DUF3097 domain-containing protein [Microcella sp.]MDX2026715.1 DUF3097 domain-containing protein [Microcella sp.]
MRDYGDDVLSGDWRAVGRTVVTERRADIDLVVELPEGGAGGDNAGGFVGAVVRVDAGNVHLEDRHGRVRVFPLGAGFLVDGEPVRLIAPVPTPTPLSRARTASGSFAVADARTRVARASRIWVEGRHDAELVEQVWGDDLRLEGVVVELLDGVDHLADMLIEFGPASGRRVGVLVDHWVPGSKETRLAEQALAQVDAQHVLIVGHPFIDIWQAVRPAVVGIDAWPDVPRDVEWKTGTCRALGWPHETVADRAAAWQRIRGRVRSYADLEPALLGRVEQLIDFVTAENSPA